MPRRSMGEVAAGLAVIAAALGFVAYGAANTGRGAARGVHLQARFDNIGTLQAGADVRIAGVPVGQVVGTSIDAASYQAIVRFTVQPDIKLPTDSSATVASGGLLGSAFLSLAPGGAEANIGDGGTITITQSAASMEDLLGKFIFNVGSLADATQKMLRQDGAPGGAKPGDAKP